MAHGRAVDVTGLLRKWRQGDEAAADELRPLVYVELRRLALRYLGRERPDHSLQSMELVHQAYLRLIDQKEARWQDRAHFFAVSGRARHRDKRGGGAAVLVLNEAIDMPEQRSVELIALDSLAKLDPQQSRVVELRFVAGLSIEETAEALNVSRATVNRDCVTAQ